MLSQPALIREVKQNIKRAIEVECVASWPRDLVKLLRENYEVLRDYELGEQRIDELARSDWRLRVYRPPNALRAQRTALISKIGEAVQHLDIIGFHCTRLEDDEVEAIKEDGLVPLSRAILDARVRSLVERKLIGEELANRLIQANYSDDENRRGMIWFVSSRSALLDQGGVGSLLGYWGGEALYMPHIGEDSSGTAKILRRIGSPRIVVTRLPINEFDIIWSIGEKIVNGFLRKNGIHTQHSPDIEGHMTRPVEPERIKRIVTHGEPEFENLTQSRSWVFRLD